MTRKGGTPRDYRSEAERVRERSAGHRRETEYNRGGRAPEIVPNNFTTASRNESQGVAPNQPTGQREQFDAVKPPAQAKGSRDRDLKKEIVHRLSIDPDLSTSEITVEVDHTIVLLTGSVDTLNTKHRVEELVSRVDGIGQIDNQLTIRVGESFEEFSRGMDASRLKEEFARNTKFQ